jgi:hypothetical protein
MVKRFEFFRFIKGKSHQHRSPEEQVADQFPQLGPPCPTLWREGEDLHVQAVVTYDGEPMDLENQFLPQFFQDGYGYNEPFNRQTFGLWRPHLANRVSPLSPQNTLQPPDLANQVLSHASLKPQDAVQTLDQANQVSSRAFLEPHNVVQPPDLAGHVSPHASLEVRNAVQPSDLEDPVSPHTSFHTHNATGSDALNGNDRKRNSWLSLLSAKLSGSYTSSLRRRIGSLLSSEYSYFSARSSSLPGGSGHLRQASYQSIPTSSTAAPTSNAEEGAQMVALALNDEAALLDACCSMPQSEDGHCIHTSLKELINGPGPLSGLESFEFSLEEVLRADRLGNNLLHVAARLGPPLIILNSMINHNTLVDLSMTNNRGETFLHLLQPHSSSAATPELAINLITTLAERHYKFCLVDETGRTWLQRWILSPKLTLNMLEPFLAALPPYAAQHILSDKTPNGQQVRRWILAKLEDAGSNMVVAAYLRIVARKYSKSNSHILMPILSIQGSVAYWLHPRRSGWNQLHQLVASAHLMESCLMAGSHASPHARAKYLADLSSALRKAGAPGDVLENRENHTHRTPMMTLLALWTRCHCIDDFLQTVFTRLLKTDSALQHRYRDSRGYTPLHYAVEFQVSCTVVLELCRSGADVNAEGLNGVRPLDLFKSLIRSQKKKEQIVDTPSAAGISILLESGTILADHGGRESNRRDLDWMDGFDWGKYLSDTGGDVSITIISKLHGVA